MSTVRATETFHHEGGTVVGGAEFDGADPVPAAFPALFEVIIPDVDQAVDQEYDAANQPDQPGPRRRGPGRPPGSRNKATGGAGG